MARSVKDLQTHLLAIKVEEMDTVVPPSTQQLIRAMKESLATAVDSYVGCLQTSPVIAKAVEKGLADLLGANKPKHNTRTDPAQFPELQQQVYGADLKLVVKEPDVKAELIGVEASFGVSCGEDTMLLLYERRDKKWSRVLRWQSGDYDQAFGAFGDFFEYVVIPHGRQDEWVVAVAHGSPWCTSRWSGFHLDVFETGHFDTSQKLLFHKDGGYDRGGDSNPILKARADGFELRLRDMSLDFDVFARTEIYRYRLVGNEVKRVQPVAMNGRDFVDEWLRVDWDEATDWSAAENLENLKNKHAVMKKLRDPKTAEKWPTFSFHAVRGCSDDQNRFQVELRLDPGEPVFFGISQGDNSFTMLSALAQPDPLCNGADLMQKH